VLATFATHGTYAWTVPTGTTTVTFTVFGASGGDVSDGTILLSKGGPGGEARGRFSVRPGEIFQVVVGGRGSQFGGFNGGGYHKNSSMGAGGGGSDVRIGGLSNGCAQPGACLFTDRIIVGGGGGGGGTNGDGGAGGGARGANAGGSGGGQEDNYFDGCLGTPQGSFGCGGWATSPTAGAGGGGWYGGTQSSTDGGGGGGSGYVSSLALSGSFPGGTRVGDGKVVISTP
jgi:hypothetical protein